MRKYQRTTPEEAERRAELFERGFTVKQIAAMQGRSEGSICSWAKKNGFARTKRLCDYLDDVVLTAAVESGKSPREIGEDFGLDVKTVRKRIKALGLEAKSKKRLNPFKAYVAETGIEQIGEYEENGIMVKVIAPAYAFGCA